MTDPSRVPGTVGAEVNYFDLIRDNSAIGRRLLDLLSAVEMPADMRPRGTFTQPIYGALNPTTQLMLEINGTSETLHVRLTVNGGYVLWQHIFEWRDPPPAVAHFDR